MLKSELAFGYGSNMDPAQMRDRCPESDLAWFTAKAVDWKFCFPRDSKHRKGGVGSLVSCQGRDVWGVVFAVTSRDLDRLDRFEGVKGNSPTYRREWIEVLNKDGNRHKVWTYFAIPKDNPAKHYPPHKDYIKLYIHGAEYFDLPKDYVDELRAIVTVKTDL
jgi:cation transport regulator ChaC